MASVLLIRHAKAEAEHRMGDWARGLTRRGRLSFRKHSRLLADRVSIRRIGTSPLVRAVQTAEILAEAFGLTDVVILPALAPGPVAARRIAKLVLELGGGWGLVGHNPSLSKAAARLLGMKELSLHLKKGSVLSVRLQATTCLFEWLASPAERWITRLRN